MKHVILGAGPAGVIAAETIRKHAPHDEIVPRRRRARGALFAHGHPLPADRQHRRGGTHLRHAGDHYARLRIEPQARPRGARLDAQAKTVTLDDGSSGRLRPAADRHRLVAGHAADPGIAGAGVHSCWTLADARAIMALAKPGARVVQMGAGFIGCIIMEALAARGVKLSVVEMGDRMVPRMMGPAAGGMIKRLVPGQGRGHRCTPAPASTPSSATPAGDEGEAVHRRRAGGRPGHQRHRRQAQHRLPGGQRRHAAWWAC
jgi:NADPH-dependent 2,4-dienoyl-CoA reductase/sulfur reductase-like enzyme